MSSIDTLLGRPPYEDDSQAKAAVLLPAVLESMLHHYRNCEPFGRFCNAQGFSPSAPIGNLADFPFLPVTVFKHVELRSADKIVRVLNSSATSSQTPSRIVIDDITRRRQLKSLAAILGDSLGATRRPFVVLDVPPGDAKPAHENQLALSARLAGLRGYLLAATDVHYVLSYSAETPILDIERLRALAGEFRNRGTPFCLLGYTYMLYKYVAWPLYEAGIQIELPPSAFVLHFGGWKKLQDEAVNKSRLNQVVCDVFKIPRARVRDIYGFTEQLGVIYPDDEEGVKRTPVYSEVIVRDPVTLQPVRDGDVGFLQFITPVPHSYPGVSVILDDLGRIVTREPSKGGRHGTGFEVVGRATGAEIRGCGDTLAPHLYGGQSQSEGSPLRLG